MELGNQVKSDNKITKKFRLLQSKYRANVLKKRYGLGPNKTSKIKYGNMLVNGENTGSNFISDAAFEFAKQKVLDKQINKSLTIDEYRLFNNMLSSMPMCFNLFSDLRKLLIEDQTETSRIVKQLFKEIDWIDKVTYIDVEFIPIPIKDYTEDKSAFDAMILVEDINGEKGLISIETKYTDLLGSNTAKNSDKKNEIIEKGKFFNQDLIDELKENGYKQLHRNYLLTYAYAKKNKFKNFINVVISPEDDKLSVEEINEMKSHMLKFKDSIAKISLEEFVERGINTGNDNFTTIMTEFRKRYFDID
ncbi:MAG: hypothetical protein GY760_02240 [Deltaproteobacteria bacterium]|nr:hypothetical protein [Deltaproteobacteria bacterium]